jgi:hypothetical protein
MGRLAGLVVLAAVIAFCVAQDRGTAAGVGRYIAAQQAALAGRGPQVTVDEVMGPANRDAVRQGLRWSGRITMAGIIGALIFRRVRLPASARSASAGSRRSIREGGKADTTSDARPRRG